MADTKATKQAAKRIVAFSTNGHKRAVLYARVSGDDTQKEDRNIKSHLEMCHDFAGEHGYRIIEELNEDDKGASGASFDLPKLGMILAMAERHEFDVLVVRELDRLSRNLAKQLIVEETLKRNGVTVEYVLADYADSPEGNLQKHVRATIAEYEREKIKERMVRGRRDVVRKGRIMLFHTQAPYGYTAVLGENHNGKQVAFGLEVNEQEARIVRMIFDWYVEGDGVYVIAHRLTEMGIPPWGDTHKNNIPRKRGYAHWCNTSVDKILKSENYIGIWHYGKDAKGAELVPLKIPAIISHETWELAQEARRNHAETSKRNTKHNYLMQFRMRCGCGYAVAVRTIRYRSYYNCISSNGSTANHLCGLLNFRADFLDQIVWDWLAEWFRDPADLRRKLEAYQAERDKVNAPILNALKVNADLIESNQAQLARIKAMCEARVYTLEETVERQTRLNDTITGLEREGKGLQARLAGALSSDDINTLIEFACLMADGVAEASESFEKRRKIIELLDVRAILTVEDGQRICTASFILASGDESKRLVIPAGRKHKLSVETTAN